MIVWPRVGRLRWRSFYNRSANNRAVREDRRRRPGTRRSETGGALIHMMSHDAVGGVSGSFESGTGRRAACALTLAFCVLLQPATVLAGNTIRHITFVTTGNTIDRVAGTGTAGTAGDGGAPLSAQLT